MIGPVPQLGLILPVGHGPASGDVAALVRGGVVESVWVRDLPAVAPGDPDTGMGSDPWWELGRLASTTTATLGTASIILGARHPLVVARAAVGVEAHAPGRFVLGIGTGGKPELNRALGLDPTDHAGFARAWHELRSLLQLGCDDEVSLHRPLTADASPPMYLATSDVGRWRTIDAQADGWQTFLTDQHDRFLDRYARICALRGTGTPVDVRLDVELLPPNAVAPTCAFVLPERGRIRCVSSQLGEVVQPWLGPPVQRLLLRAHGHRPERAVHELHRLLTERARNT